MMYVQAIIGFALLLGAAEILVRGAVSLARILGISPLVIGMTVVAFGTSAPEFVVSGQAALDGVAGIALGNVIGSNIANIMLILGVAGLIMPIKVNPKMLRSDALILIAVTALFVVLCLAQALGLIGGVILLVAFIAFLVTSYVRETRSRNPEAQMHAQEAEEVEALKGGPWVAAAATVGGLAGIIFGADLLVTGGTEIARTFGVSEEVIGLTMIAIGTSLPELAASAVAARRGHADVAVGNVVGSNLFNILGVMGVAAVLAPAPIAIADQIFQFDLWVLAGATVILLPFLTTNLRLDRWEAGLLLGGYVLYIAVQAIGVDRLFGA
ncbi:MAG: calcium/sodium antiporter [Magnetospiraceae bacterium]